MKMSNTIFIALQCCQCSMMQVKQKKKSSNKWTCVVCNQKQSVRKVFAQGYMAKDLRQFVQSFNMSLKDPPQEEQQQEGEMLYKKTKLTKYPNSCGEEEGYDQFKKPILSSQAQVGDMEAKGTQQRSAKVDSKWRDYLTEEKPRTSQPTMTYPASKWRDYMTQDDDEEKPRTSRLTMTYPASKWRDYMTQDDMKNPRHCQANMGKAASKWSEYLTEDDQEQRIHRPLERNDASKWKNFLTNEEDDLPASTGRESVNLDHKGKRKNGIFQTKTHDEEVEDDIHPDFI